MRFDITSIPLTMVTSVITNSLKVHKSYFFGNCDSTEGKSITNFAYNGGNANAGFRGTNVSVMTAFYMD